MALTRVSVLGAGVSTRANPRFAMWTVLNARHPFAGNVSAGFISPGREIEPQGPPR